MPSTGASSHTSASSTCAAGFGFGGGVTVGKGDTYRLSVGTSTTFSGSIPAIPDDPQTATDEFLLYSYNTMPYVYRKTYTTIDGSTGGYYVVYYALP